MTVANLSMYQGEDKTFNDQILEADGTTPQDITGWTVQFVICAYDDPTTVFITKSCSPVGSPTLGVTGCTVVHADTLGMNPDQYSYYFNRVDSGANSVPTVGLFTLLKP